MELAAVHRRAHRLVKRFDMNGDKKLDAAELSRALPASPEAFANAEKLISQYDRNGDHDFRLAEARHAVLSRVVRAVARSFGARNRRT